MAVEVEIIPRGIIRTRPPPTQGDAIAFATAGSALAPPFRSTSMTDPVEFSTYDIDKRSVAYSCEMAPPDHWIAANDAYLVDHTANYAHSCQPARSRAYVADI